MPSWALIIIWAIFSPVGLSIYFPHLFPLLKRRHIIITIQVFSESLSSVISSLNGGDGGDGVAWVKGGDDVGRLVLMWCDLTGPSLISGHCVWLTQVFATFVDDDDCQFPSSLCTTWVFSLIKGKRQANFLSSTDSCPFSLLLMSVVLLG